jgi:chromosome segregation ATPase
MSSDSRESDSDDSRKLLLSAYALMLQDRIAQEQSRKSSKSSDFWTKLDGLVSKHSSQMQTLARMASDVRSDISVTRTTASSEHHRRMEESRAALSALQSQVRQANVELQKDERAALRTKEQRLRAQLVSLDSEAATLADSVVSLERTSARVKARLETKKAEYEAKVKSVGGRSRDAQWKADQLEVELELVNRELMELDDELSDLGFREAACRELCASLKQPLPLVRRGYSGV